LALRLVGMAVGQKLPKDTNQIRALTVAQAEALAQHLDDLSLDGLKSLSDEAAKALAQHQGHLHLVGLLTLSDEAARALIAHPRISLPARFRR